MDKIYTLRKGKTPVETFVNHIKDVAVTEGVIEENQKLSTLKQLVALRKKVTAIREKIPTKTNSHLLRHLNYAITGTSKIVKQTTEEPEAPEEVPELKVEA